MEDDHKTVLDRMMKKIINRISDPDTMAACITVLTERDREYISRCNKHEGPIKGTQELLVRLKKRGPKAFPEFLNHLKEDCEDLAREIERELEGLRGRPYRSTPAVLRYSSTEETSKAEPEGRRRNAFGSCLK